MKYVLAIDQGTTSTRAILFDENGLPYANYQKEVLCTFPCSGWVETDAVEIWLSVIGCISELLVKSNIDFSSIDSIGITNQRETTVVWDKKTGMPVYNAIVWQSRQTADICDKYASEKELIHEKTGLLINPYFSASKIRFILDNIPNGQQRAENGELMFGTIDTWLIYKLTKGKVYATDVSNASRTLLFNIHNLSWDKELCNLFNIPMCMLPEIKDSSYDYGAATFFTNDVHIRGVAGDQQASLFGQTCFDIGDCKNTYGTGCFLLFNTGNTPIFSKNGLLTTIGWKIKDQIVYALEGSVFIGGAVIQWLRDQMNIISNASESETLANSVQATGGVYVIPAFTGLGTPYWDDDARGAVFGLTRGTSKAQFVRACLESIAYQSKDLFETIKKETSISIKELCVDGGATANKYLMQFQSDILKTKVILPKCLETTALGVAYLAGLSSGFFKSLEDIKKIHSYQAIFTNKMDEAMVDRKYNCWKKAVEATRLYKVN